MLRFENAGGGIFYFLHEGWGDGHFLMTCLIGQQFPTISANGKENEFYPRFNKYYALTSENNKDET